MCISGFIFRRIFPTSIPFVFALVSCLHSWPLLDSLAVRLSCDLRKLDQYAILSQGALDVELDIDAQAHVRYCARRISMLLLASIRSFYW